MFNLTFCNIFNEANNFKHSAHVCYLQNKCPEFQAVDVQCFLLLFYSYRLLLARVPLGHSYHRYQTVMVAMIKKMKSNIMHLYRPQLEMSVGHDLTPSSCNSKRAFGFTIMAGILQDWHMTTKQELVLKK